MMVKNVASLEIKNDPSEETSVIMNPVTSNCVLKKIWQCAKIIRNNCSECRAIFKVHSHTQYIEAKQRAWSESSHTFSQLFRRDFLCAPEKRPSFIGISQWNQIFCEVEYSHDLTKHPLKFQRVYSSVHELQMQPLKVFNSIVYQYKGT